MCGCLSERCLDTFISRRPSSNDTSTDHGPCDDGNHGPCNQEDQLNEHDTLHSEEQIHTLEDKDSVILVEYMDHGPLSTDQGEIMCEQVSVESEHVNNLDCDANIQSSQTQCHIQNDRRSDNSRTIQLNHVDVSTTRPDSPLYVVLSQHSPGKTASQSISESSGIGEMSQMSDSDPNLEMVICGKESTNLENKSGRGISGEDCPQEDGAQEGYCEGQDGGTAEVSSRSLCSAAPSGSIQRTDGHIARCSTGEDMGETQPIIQIVVSFSIIAVDQRNNIRVVFICN